jgi:hypothetical protein
MLNQLRSISNSNPTRNLSPRFHRILDIIDFAHLDQTQSYIADIGGDHGILTSYISSLSNCKNVIYTDQSPTAAANAKEYFQKIHASKNIIVNVGNGLEPLLGLNVKCHTIIMSGMGCNTILDIINHQSKLPAPLPLLSPVLPLRITSSSDNYNNNKFASSSSSSSSSSLPLQQLSLFNLGVEDILIQPYPPHLITMLQMIKVLASYGYVLQQQYIDQFDAKKWFYITMRFSRNLSSTDHDKYNGENNDKDIISIFNHMPLTVENCHHPTSTSVTTEISNSSSMDKPYNNNKINNHNNISSNTNISTTANKELWRSYLIKELVTLEKVVDNANASADTNYNYYNTTHNRVKINNYATYVELQSIISRYVKVSSSLL